MYKRKRSNSYSGPRRGMQKRSNYKTARRSFSRSGYKSRANRRTGGFVGLEKKFFDAIYPATAIVTTVAGAEADPEGVNDSDSTNMGALNSISMGTGPTQRDGRKATFVSCNVKGFLKLASGTALSSGETAIIRLVLVKDKQTNGAQLNSEDVYDDNAGLNGATDDAISLGVLAYRNIEHMKRYDVLFDKKYTLQPQAAGSDATSPNFPGLTMPFNISKKLKFQTLFNTNTASGRNGTVADIEDNSLHLLAFASRSGCTLEYTCRMRFFG